MVILPRKIPHPGLDVRQQPIDLHGGTYSYTNDKQAATARCRMQWLAFQRRRYIFKPLRSGLNVTQFAYYCYPARLSAGGVYHKRSSQGERSANSWLVCIATRPVRPRAGDDETCKAMQPEESSSSSDLTALRYCHFPLASFAMVVRAWFRKRSDHACARRNVTGSHLGSARRCRRDTEMDKSVRGRAVLHEAVDVLPVSPYYRLAEVLS